MNDRKSLNARYYAAALESFGDAHSVQLRRFDLPVPARGQILVQVDAAAVNPIDARRRGGYGRRLLSLMGAARLPLVLGNDFAGIVCAVGSGVTTWREGDAVYGAKPPSRLGSHATHVAVAASHVLARPSGRTAEQLAALPYNFLTVWRALAGAGINGDSVRGRKVLVHGASGGLGLIALRLLQAMRAEVTAIAGGAHLAACHDAGAAVVLDRYTTPVESLPADFAATLNFGSWDDEAALIARLGRGALGHASTVHPLLTLVDQHGVAGGLLRAWRERRSMAACVPAGARHAWTVFRNEREGLEALAACLALLDLPTSLVTYPLEHAALAHRHLEQRRPGRVILLPSHH